MRQHNCFAIQAHQINWENAWYSHSTQRKKEVPHLVHHSRKALYSSSENVSTEEPKTRNYERMSGRFDLHLSPLRVNPDGSLYTSSSTKTYLRDYCLTGARWTQFIYRGFIFTNLSRGHLVGISLFAALNTEAVTFPLKRPPTFEATLRSRNWTVGTKK
jgi:hypothetical protein